MLQYRIAQRSYCVKATPYDPVGYEITRQPPHCEAPLAVLPPAEADERREKAGAACACTHSAQACVYTC